MSTIELKKQLIDKITSLKESSILTQLLDLIDFETDQGQYKLTEEQKNIISDAKRKMDAGEYLTNHAVEEETSKWLSE